MIERVGNRIVTVAERILALGLILAILLDFANVLGRYTGAFSVLGIDEVEIYILIWIAFVGSAAVTWRSLHLRMDVFVEACPLPVKRVIVTIEMAVMFAVTAFVGTQSYAYVAKIVALGAVSDIAGIPMWIPHSAVCIGFFAIAAIVLARGVERLRVVDQVKGEVRP
ncbi:TRAP transporter small permease [Pseudolabrys taiwanensis]|uniref:TRAP transporter small permease protein n=1 Tax=Pseudolabrys taiwanensis TaxID=331696 RepID=A0A345ZVK3_9HYPH|nr:TRAP transporter small permease [Pseudolabrys taiwanensis]AXK80950.1 TRAP transporter small permease [Pseudolabrys taiwanensis]